MSINIIETNFSFGILSDRSKTTRLVYHHVAGNMTPQAIHNLHKNTNGWSGIGYHFVIDKDGKIYRGRPISKIGAHATGYNSDSVGVCFNGNFETEQMTAAQIQSGKELTTYLLGLYPTITLIQRHRDIGSTACPGTNFKFNEIKAGTNGTVTSSSNAASADISYIKNGKVGVVQKALNASYNSKLAIDDIWGPLSQKAAKTNPLSVKANMIKNAYVGAVQQMLTDIGYSVGSTGIDEWYGKKTEAAVIKLQKDNLLTQDGVVGIDTITAILKKFG